jgi:hypothetical protein
MLINDPHEKNRIEKHRTFTREEALSIVKPQLLDNFLQRQASISRSLCKPLPGAARGAFLNRSITVGDKQIQRITAYIWMVIEALDSPLLKLLELSATQKEPGKVEIKTKWKPFQIWELCYIFSLPHDELEAKFEGGAIQDFKKAAHKEVGKYWDAALIDLAFAAIMEQFKRHVETKVKVYSEMEAKGDVTFFRESMTSSKPAASVGS